MWPTEPCPPPEHPIHAFLEWSPLLHRRQEVLRDGSRQEVNIEAPEHPATPPPSVRFFIRQ